MLHTVIARDYHRAVTQTFAPQHVTDRRQRRARRQEGKEA